MNENDINEYIPSILNPRAVKKDRGDITLTQNSVASRCSLSLRRNNILSKPRNVSKIFPPDKENVLINNNSVITLPPKKHVNKKQSKTSKTEVPYDDESIGFSAIQDLDVVQNSNFSPQSISDIVTDVDIKKENEHKISNSSLLSVSSATDLDTCMCDSKSDTTVIYELDRPIVSVSFGIINCKKVDISAHKSRLKRIFVSTENDETTVDCEVVENSQLSSVSNLDENMNEAVLPSPPNKAAVSVSLEIKKKKLSADTAENSKVLILNTDAIEKISHVIVQPPNYKLVKRQNFKGNKIKSGVKNKSLKSPLKNGKGSDSLKQRSIEEFLPGKGRVNAINLPKLSEVRTIVNGYNDGIVARDVGQDMSKNLGVTDVIKCDRIGRSSCKSRKDESSKSGKPASRRGSASPRLHDIKNTSSSDAPQAPSPRSSHSPRKNVDSIHFSLPSKLKSAKTSTMARNIPHHKIVAGTHFAVDAFSYGEIPNVKHYFLTHFHSDHYSGLKKTFSRLLFCSKITADLCISRLGVSPKCIHVINTDETIRVESVEITAVDANHCPGALMLVFTLPNGKTLLHTGDFRASPIMESYPIFWNKDIHTVYLDTTYCNPRYDFPTQDQSLEMALYLLRQKKLTLEKAGREFASVLIVCGTYTIGKEKFFLGMARRVGCSVWACPEKDRVLQAVEGRSFSHAPPQSCQLHVVPMRDLTHEKLRSYLDSLQGPFQEVVAFKPSGWENGKNSSVEKDLVTIHGIPYSEHSSFSEMIRFVKFVKPKQVVPTVDISGGIKAVQKYFPCPLVFKEDFQCQSKVTDYFSIQNRQQVTAVT